LKSSVSRVLTRAGLAATVGLIAATAFAAPASAAPDDSDLSVRFEGTTIAALAPGKFSKLTIRNDGPGAGTGVKVTFDVSALDDGKIEFDLSPDCSTVGDEVTCAFDDSDIPPAGGETEVPIPIGRKASATPGPAGSIKATISSDTNDPNSGNNSQTVNVVVGTSGADVQVVAFDVYALDGAGDPTTDPVPLGGSSEVQGIIFNWGDMTAVGIKVVVTLPEFVTFGEVEPDCTYSADNRVATCTYDDVVLGFFQFLGVFWPVNVAADAPGPTALQGGSMVVSAIDVRSENIPEARALPKNMRRIAPDDVPDVDPSDNTDPFAVFVAGDLPVTGAQAGLYAMSGAGLLVLGVLIVLLARRRRNAPATTG